MAETKCKGVLFHAYQPHKVAQTGCESRWKLLSLLRFTVREHWSQGDDRKVTGKICPTNAQRDLTISQILDTPYRQRILGVGLSLVGTQ